MCRKQHTGPISTIFKRFEYIHSSQEESSNVGISPFDESVANNVDDVITVVVDISSNDAVHPFG